MERGGTTMNNKHILTETCGDDVATIIPNRTKVHDAFIAELPMTVSGRVTRRVPYRQVPDEALLRRIPG
jgi:hypothetical protein